MRIEGVALLEGEESPAYLSFGEIEAYGSVTHLSVRRNELVDCVFDVLEFPSFSEGIKTLLVAVDKPDVGIVTCQGAEPLEVYPLLPAYRHSGLDLRIVFPFIVLCDWVGIILHRVDFVRIRVELPKEVRLREQFVPYRVEGRIVKSRSTACPGIRPGNGNHLRRYRSAESLFDEDFLRS